MAHVFEELGVIPRIRKMEVLVLSWKRVKNYTGICFVAVVASKMKMEYVSQLHHLRRPQQSPEFSPSPFFLVALIFLEVGVS